MSAPFVIGVKGGTSVSGGAPWRTAAGGARFVQGTGILWGTWYGRGARRHLHGGRAGHRAAGATVFTFVIFGAVENGVQVHGSGCRQEG